jgi:hypothetical protein
VAPPVSIADISDGAGTVSLAGRTYHLNKMTPNGLGKIRSWLRARMPRPFAVVAAFCEANHPGPPPQTPPPGDDDAAKRHAGEMASWQMRKVDYEADREKLLLAAKEDYEAGDAVLDRPAARRLLGQPAGVAMMLYVSAQKDTAGLRLEDLERDIDAASLAELAAVRAALDAVNEIPDAVTEAMEKKAPAHPGTGPPPG